MRKTLIALLVFCFFVSGVVSYNTYTNSQYQTSVQTFENMYAAACRIKMEDCFGSGVVIYSEKDIFGDYNTYVLTCNHLFSKDDSKIIHIEFFDKQGQPRLKVPGRLIAKSPNNEGNIDEDGNFYLDLKNSGEDVALIKLQSNKKFPVAKLPTMEQALALKMLDKVRVIGAALADKPIPTFGEITRVEKDFITINADAIFGNSGGPCYLASGELIGLVNMGRGTGNQFLTHMIFIRPIDNIYDWLKKIGYECLLTKEGAQSVFQQEKAQQVELLQLQLNQVIGLLDRISQENTEFSQANKALEQQMVILLQRIEKLENELKTLENLMKEKENEEICSPSIPACPEN